MKLSKVFFATLSLFALFALNGATVKESGTHYAEKAVMPFIKKGQASGAISIIYNNGIQETSCMGYANVEKKIPIALNQLFMQCSQTKGFCGVTMAILLEEGRISLDDPVCKYLPEFKTLNVIDKKVDGKVITKPAKNVLTIRMVMNHTGGFPFEIPSKKANGWSSKSLRDTAKEAAANPLLFEPGTKMTYSNTGIDIGAAVIEVVTGKPWEVFLKERVLDPLGMKDTTFYPTDEQLANSICLYNCVRKPASKEAKAKGKKGVYKKAKFAAFNHWMPLPHNGPTVFPSAGAGLWTTANDQLKFYKMLMNLGVSEDGKRLLKEETVKKYLATNSRPEGLGSYSMGLNIRENNWIGHGGAWSTQCYVNYERKQLKLLVLQNSGDKPFPWSILWERAANEFLKNQAQAEADSYTGRLD